MVHKRADRPTEGYRIKRQLPLPWDAEITWQTRYQDKRSAERVAVWLDETIMSRPVVIDGILAGQWTLREAWIAYRRGTLDRLIAGETDPSLADAVIEYREVCEDGRARTGLDQLITLAPARSRLAWLTRKTITKLYADAQTRQKPNTVRRGLHRAVRELLAFHLGEARTRDIYAEIRAPGEDDTRDVSITPVEVRAMLDRITVERFRWLVVLATLTTADRRPLLALKPEHVDLEAGTLTIPDRKTRARWRVVRLAGPGLVAARLAVEGVPKGERLFPYTESQAYALWCACRPSSDFRFKDLRKLLPSTLAAMRVDRKEIAALLGHAPGSRETQKYITPVGDLAALEAAADRLGLTGWQARAG